ncbi:predicted protein [Histoplasma mississippiense (nom. inval.)]|uniref:predicted protein n=3 Tax=Ajellomyces capsulatus (strain NAm1 / WU24) TaxID=2059318 RepID=UPI000157D31C|nr:predicted protein [Histoplasma mississippiense (nom. inval.)]EDN04920.1 predicted protein [Histoplasma mississippiense (nom. inval.)]
MNTMRKHWQNKHSWSPYPSRGRTAPQKRTAAQDEVDRSCQKVQFQQVFASRKGSHYIQIQTKETTEHTGTPDQNRASHVIDELERFDREQQRQTSNVIQAGEHDEANPWLRRTRWPVYLTNIAPNDLVNCVQRPDDDTTCPDELAARAIWEAMGQVARTSQRVITRLGHFVRIEAIRTERHQTRHTPLQAYMDEESIAEHPTVPVHTTVATTERADQRHSISPDPMNEQMTEEEEEEEEVEEEEEEKRQRDTQSEEEDKFKLVKIQMACLDFCIELLNQWVQMEDYECALIDTLAVLGRGERVGGAGTGVVWMVRRGELPTNVVTDHQGGTVHGGAQGAATGRQCIRHAGQEPSKPDGGRVGRVSPRGEPGGKEMDDDSAEQDQIHTVFRVLPMRDAAVHMQQLEDTEAVSVQGIFDPDSGNDDVWVSQQLREFNVNADDQEAVIEFLRQKVEGQGIEHNQLMEMFCWLRGIYQEAERGKIESEGTGVK